MEQLVQHGDSRSLFCARSWHESRRTAQALRQPTVNHSGSIRHHDRLPSSHARQDSHTQRGSGMKFCSNCGGPISHIIPQGDNRLRHVCAQCQTVHYQNPRIIAGCLPCGASKCCSAAAPSSHGAATGPCRPALWRTAKPWNRPPPARPMRKPARGCSSLNLYTLFDLPHINQVYMLFRAELVDLDFRPARKASRLQLFHEQDIPWSELAFPTIGRTLECYFADRRSSTTRSATSRSKPCARTTRKPFDPWKLRCAGCSPYSA